jgi:non-ribosomal peptide synthetase component E (peptide arylation enzyme)
MRTIPADLVRRYEEEGWWTRDTMGDLLARGLAAAPEAEFRVHSAVRPWSGTFGDVERVARRLAAGLLARGVGPGDDRKSDIIIRGGENVSAAEVEELLLGMPAVAEAAVVAAPDARLGEHAAAVLRLRPGHPAPALGEIQAHLERAGLARQKWPEEVHAVADLPRTPSGKVQKFLLRRQIAAHELGE